MNAPYRRAVSRTSPEEWVVVVRHGPIVTHHRFHDAARADALVARLVCEGADLATPTKKENPR